MLQEMVGYEAFGSRSSLAGSPDPPTGATSLLQPRPMSQDSFSSTFANIKVSTIVIVCLLVITMVSTTSAATLRPVASPSLA
jgi:hypothetical protein